MESVDKQIEELKKLTGTKKNTELSVALDVKATTISTWKTRGSVPQKIIDAAKLKFAKKTSNDDKNISLPFYEVSASAGTGFLVEKENQPNLINFQHDWLRTEIGVNPNDVFLMMASGDSMYPTIKCGAMIMVNRHLDGLSDGVYVMRHENNLLVKRLQSLPTGVIKVKSDNPLYEPWEIKREHLNGVDFEIIGRVVWTGQRM